MQTGTQREHHVEMQGEGSQLQAKERGLEQILPQSPQREPILLTL